MKDALEFAIISTSTFISFGFIGGVILEFISNIKRKKQEKNNAK